MKTSEAVNKFNILKGLNVKGLPKEEATKVFANTRVLRATATEFETFLSDVRERMKPDGFDEAIEKSQRFAILTDDEKREVNDTIAKYNKDVEDCVREALEKEVEAELKPLGEDSLMTLANNNELTVEQLLALE